MKFNCGKSQKQKAKEARVKDYLLTRKLRVWHRFYPYFPRRVAENDCRCFEWIERKLVGYSFLHETNTYDYRQIDKGEK